MRTIALIEGICEAFVVSGRKLDCLWWSGPLNKYVDAWLFLYAPIPETQSKDPGDEIFKLPFPRNVPDSATADELWGGFGVADFGNVFPSRVPAAVGGYAAQAFITFITIGLSNILSGDVCMAAKEA